MHSGVPQATALRQILFNTLTSDIVRNIRTEIRLLAYDCVWHRRIRYRNDFVLFHRRTLINSVFGQINGARSSRQQVQNDEIIQKNTKHLSLVHSAGHCVGVCQPNILRRHIYDATNGANIKCWGSCDTICPPVA